MERVVFLLEPDGERLGCLLNPESLVVSRNAGVTASKNAGGLVAGDALADDPLHFTGGGCTQFTFDLLFDVSIAGSSIQTNDVRALTGPLWDLAENKTVAGGPARPSLCRFIWGRAWNVPGIVTAVAERLEYFDADGVPRRSWLRMRFVRVAQSLDEQNFHGVAAPNVDHADAAPADYRDANPSYVHHPIAGEAASPGGGDRLDQLAYRYYGDATKWRCLAHLNDLVDPLVLAVGSVLNVFTQDDLDASR